MSVHYSIVYCASSSFVEALGLFRMSSLKSGPGYWQIFRNHQTAALLISLLNTENLFRVIGFGTGV